MTVREQADKIFEHKVVGKLKQMKEGANERYFGLRWYIDEEGAEYFVEKSTGNIAWITLPDGGVM